MALLVLYLDLRIQQLKSLPSGECVHGEAGTEVLASPFHRGIPQDAPESKVSPSPIHRRRYKAQETPVLGSDHTALKLLVLPVIKIVTEV